MTMTRSVSLGACLASGHEQCFLATCISNKQAKCDTRKQSIVNEDAYYQSKQHQQDWCDKKTSGNDLPCEQIVAKGTQIWYVSG